jgi:hypothetical protein
MACGKTSALTLLRPKNSVPRAKLLNSGRAKERMRIHIDGGLGAGTL